MLAAILRKVVLGILGAVIAVTVLATATVYALRAAALWLSRLTQDPALGLVLTAAAAVILLALVLFPVLRRRRSRRRRAAPPAAAAAPPPDGVPPQDAELLGLLAGLAQNYPFVAVGLAGVAGILKGSKASR